MPLMDTIIEFDSRISPLSRHYQLKLYRLQQHTVRYKIIQLTSNFLHVQKLIRLRKKQRHISQVFKVLYPVPSQLGIIRNHFILFPKVFTLNAIIRFCILTQKIWNAFYSIPPQRSIIVSGF